MNKKTKRKIKKAKAFLKKHEYKKAVNVINSFLSADWDLREVQRLTLKLYFQTAQWTKLEKSARVLVAKYGSDFPFALISLGHALVRLGRVEQAQVFVEDAVIADPDCAGLWFEFARCRAVSGDFREANYALHRMLEIDENLRPAAESDADFDGFWNWASCQLKAASAN